MASLAVNAKVQGTTRTVPRGGNSQDSNNGAAVSRAKVIAVGLFVLLVALHITDKD